MTFKAYFTLILALLDLLALLNYSHLKSPNAHTELFFRTCLRKK
jgi:hypothetical protein